MLLLSLSILAACGTNPWPEATPGKIIYYTSYPDDPKHLDPALAYYEHEAAVIDNIYETLFQYHYLKRPYVLEPALAETFPVRTELSSGTTEPRVVYTIRLKPGVMYHEDPCFAAPRAIRAEDFINAFKRIADPKLDCPVRPVFMDVIAGMKKFHDANEKAAATDYAIPLSGVRAKDTHTLEIELTHPYPQILYWLAMHFTSPMPKEAIDYYTGRDGRPSLDDHPVGSGPFRLKEWKKRLRIVLEKNPFYREEFYPIEGMPDDIEEGLLRDAGKQLPLLDEVVMGYETEAIPRWRKFLQGWYDGTGLAPEVFDHVVTNQRGLSDEMAASGMKLSQVVEPSIFYFAFNMKDPVVGGDSPRTRKLRQAFSLAFDAPRFLRVLLNGRGIAPQEILPPGIFGHRGDTSPFAGPDLERAKKLLAEAGYPHGVDPATRRPLVVSFDNTMNSPSERSMLQFITDQFQALGIRVEARTTDLNTYRKKIREGNYQFIMTGWNMDYPDPENMFFLLEGKQAVIPNGGENHANFQNAEFDRLYARMARMENSPEREALIHRMTEIVRVEAPWIPIFFRESYTLIHGWLGNYQQAPIMNNTLKYRNIEPTRREEYRARESSPLFAPAILIGAAIFLLSWLGIRRRKNR